MAHRFLLSFLIFTSVFLSSSIQSTEAEVITLTDDTFHDKVKEKDTAWFVKFCVSWCKHCKNLGTLWEDLGKAMEGEDEIEVGEVDCGTNKELCSKVDIHSYPTFKLFYNGEEFAKYQGSAEMHCKFPPPSRCIKIKFLYFKKSEECGVPESICYRGNRKGSKKSSRGRRRRRIT